MTPEEATSNPAKLAFALGELTGTVKQVIDQRDIEHRENKERFDAQDVVLREIKEKGTGISRDNAARIVELEKTSDKQDERLTLLERWRFVLVGAWLATSVIVTGVITAAKLWHDFLS